MAEINLASIVPVLTAVAAGIVRSFGGWLTKAMEDGKISKFELSQLGGTVVRVSLITTALFYGFQGLGGIEVTVLGAAGGAYVADLILRALKK